MCQYLSQFELDEVAGVLYTRIGIISSLISDCIAGIGYYNEYFRLKACVRNKPVINKVARVSHVPH